MTDREILDIHNDTIRAREEAAAAYQHVAVEVPPGQPQVGYFEQGNQWVPRGEVLLCVVHDAGPEGEMVIEIDEHEFSLAEFWRMQRASGTQGASNLKLKRTYMEMRPDIR